MAIMFTPEEIEATRLEAAFQSILNECPACNARASLEVEAESAARLLRGVVASYAQARLEFFASADPLKGPAGPALTAAARKLDEAIRLLFLSVHNTATEAARREVGRILADGYSDGSMMSDPLSSSIHLSYATAEHREKAEKAHELICELIDGAIRERAKHADQA